MTNVGKKFYYICNYRIKKGFHKCPAVIYALFPSTSDALVMVYSCGIHDHRRLTGLPSPTTLQNQPMKRNEYNEIKAMMIDMPTTVRVRKNYAKKEANLKRYGSMSSADLSAMNSAKVRRMANSHNRNFSSSNGIHSQFSPPLMPSFSPNGSFQLQQQQAAFEYLNTLALNNNNNNNNNMINNHNNMNMNLNNNDEDRTGSGASSSSPSTSTSTTNSHSESNDQSKNMNNNNNSSLFQQTYAMINLLNSLNNQNKNKAATGNISGNLKNKFFLNYILVRITDSGPKNNIFHSY
jgi:hypothetical protein